MKLVPTAYGLTLLAAISVACNSGHKDSPSLGEGDVGQAAVLVPLDPPMEKYQFSMDSSALQAVDLSCPGMKEVSKKLDFVPSVISGTVEDGSRFEVDAFGSLDLEVKLSTSTETDLFSMKNAFQTEGGNTIGIRTRASFAAGEQSRTIKINLTDIGGEEGGECFVRLAELLTDKAQNGKDSKIEFDKNPVVMVANGATRAQLEAIAADDGLLRRVDDIIATIVSSDPTLAPKGRINYVGYSEMRLVNPYRVLDTKGNAHDFSDADYAVRVTNRFDFQFQGEVAPNQFQWLNQDIDYFFDKDGQILAVVTYTRKKELPVVVAK